VIRVVFVCTGNICRSPSAEAVLRAKVDAAGLSDHILVSSAGLANWHVGKDADPRSLSALRARGYALRHSAQHFKISTFDEHDVFVAMDTGHLSELRSLGGPEAEVRLMREWDPQGNGSVPDPYYDDDMFGDVLAMIERSCDGLLADLRSRLQPTST
jgi:protein-tyrosine phosphatase